MTRRFLPEKVFAALNTARVAYIVIGGVVVRVASLDDVIRSKRAADRPKDLETLPTLDVLRDRQRPHE